MTLTLGMFVVIVGGTIAGLLLWAGHNGKRVHKD